MTNTNFTITGDGGPDDLPRTLRREREAREAAAREREARQSASSAAAESLSVGEAAYAPVDAEPLAATVKRFDVPFLHMVSFFIKAVLASVPALFLLGVILWGAGALMQKFFPHLVKMQILIWFPNP